MARNKSRGRSAARARAHFLEKGVLALFLGAAFSSLSYIASPSPLIAPIAQALRIPGIVALAIGAVLIGIHFILKARQPAVANGSAPEHAATTPNVNLPATSSRQPAWSPAVFPQIEWRRFEAVCEALFAQAGFETRTQSHGADGGVDIWLLSRNVAGPAGIVQCKHWQGKQVGVKELREFFGVMASHKLQRGTYATTSTFTADALAFARQNGINAMDGSALLKLIGQRTPEQQVALLEVAYEGEYWRPTCANCGIKLVERARKEGGAAFWGCANYPKCRTTMARAAGLER